MAITGSSAPAFFRPNALDEVVKLYDAQQGPRLYQTLVTNKDHKAVNLRVATVGDLPAAGPIDPLRGIPMVDRATPYYRDYTFTRYAIGAEYDRALTEIDWYKIVSDTAVMLNKAVDETLDIMAAGVFNFGATTSGPITLITPDGLPLFSTGHLLSTGTQSNIVTGNSPLSWMAISDSAAQKRRFLTHERNPVRRGMMNNVMVSPENFVEMQEIAKSTDRPDVSDRATNILKGMIGEVVSDPLFTSTTAWVMSSSKDNDDVQLVFRSRKHQAHWQANEFDRVRHSVVVIAQIVAMDWRNYIYSAGA